MAEALKYTVDIDTANKTKQEMAESLKTTNKRVLNSQSAFSSLYDFSFPEYKNPVLVQKTEEPGSKQVLAFQYDRIESICYDMINHLINDCIVMGAKPLTIQDAIICGKIEKEKVKRLVKAISEACKEQDCILTGGETSEQPGVINEGIYILTSSIVGIVDKDDIIDGSKINVGDVVIGVESSGVHTNGYTLIRQLIKQKPDIINDIIDGKTFLDLILEPHRCYYNTIKNLFPEKVITGLAHITGGGIRENLDRILPENTDAVIDLSKYQILPVFKKIRQEGNVAENEMLRTFNMSIGLVIVCPEASKSRVMNHILEQNINCYEIGEIVLGNQKVQTVGSLNW